MTAQMQQLTSLYTSGQTENAITLSNGDMITNSKSMDDALNTIIQRGRRRALRLSMTASCPWWRARGRSV